MNWDFEKVTGMFTEEKSSLLLNGRWGIEREAQRVTTDGELALTPHPAAFGNKLKNETITTDFSESQLELITPPFESIEETYEYLEGLYLQVEKELGSELIWPMSMPPRLPEEEKIPIARFDNSTEGNEKELYRIGLGNRYGRKMQMISGIHYNFSFGDRLIDYLYQHFGNGINKRKFIDNLYFSMARNFLRYRWLIIYLFGSSPDIDQTYYSVIENELNIIKKCCPDCFYLAEYEKSAVSLRVSRFGYSDSVQGKYSISYNNLEDYIKGIRKLLKTKSSEFSKLGLYRDGKRIQLNDNVIQKESEFYTSIRLKQNVLKGETQLDVLENKGVKYAEVRIIDINPFEKTGISLEQLRFLQVFMLYCLFEDGRLIKRNELERINKNHHLVALSGRKEQLKLFKYNRGKSTLEEWSKDIFEKLFLIASLIESVNKDNRYMECIVKEYEKISDISKLPSYQIQREMKQNGESFLDFGSRKAAEYRNATEQKAYIYYTFNTRELV